MERLEFDLLFRWLVVVAIDDAAWDHANAWWKWTSRRISSAAERLRLLSTDRLSERRRGPIRNHQTFDRAFRGDDRVGHSNFQLKSERIFSRCRLGPSSRRCRVGGFSSGMGRLDEVATTISRRRRWPWSPVQQKGFDIAVPREHLSSVFS